MTRRNVVHAPQMGPIVGRNVKRLREERMLTQYELSWLWRANGLNWARSKVSALETGDRPRIDVADLMIMALALGVPLSELLLS